MTHLYTIGVRGKQGDEGDEQTSETQGHTGFARRFAIHSEGDMA